MEYRQQMVIVAIKAATPMKTPMMRMRIWIQSTLGALLTCEHLSTLFTEYLEKTVFNFLFLLLSNSLLTLSKSTTSSSLSST